MMVSKLAIHEEIMMEEAKTTIPMKSAHMAINQGDLYWIRLEETGIAHPYVVVQDNLFNHSRIHTVVVCALTSNRKQAKAPGNVLLDAGEANLPRQSAVVVSKISTVAKTQLGEYIGTLSAPRMDQIMAGIRFLQSITENR